MDEKIKATLQKIKALSEQNLEFAQELRKMFGKASSASVVSVPGSVSNDVSAIREALEIRANKSISYDFVKEQRLRDQLIIDNLRMENAALNLQQNETERFYTFCVNAFYQLENIVNLYFHSTYPNIGDLLSIVEEYTDQETSDYFKFKRTGKEKNVGDIQIAHKINAICNMLFPGDQFKMTLGTLRQVRNEGEHRCMVIQKEKDENNNLYKFFKYNNFNSVRIDLIKLVGAIKNNIGKPLKPQTTVVDATITSLLPSACYIKYSDQPESLPSKLISKVKGKNAGDTIKIVLSNGRILDIQE